MNATPEQPQSHGSRPKFQFPRYKAGPVEYWLAEAITQFINGCMHGFGGGSFVGLGTGVGTAASPLGENMTPLKNAILSIGAIALSCIGQGVTQFRDWHKNGNPFPNPWPKPTGNTNPPFPPTTT